LHLYLYWSPLVIFLLDQTRMHSRKKNGKFTFSSVVPQILVFFSPSATAFFLGLQIVAVCVISGLYLAIFSRRDVVWRLLVYLMQNQNSYQWVALDFWERENQTQVKFWSERMYFS
jgi:hypothetical protein